MTSLERRVYRAVVVPAQPVPAHPAPPVTTTALTMTSMTTPSQPSHSETQRKCSGNSSEETPSVICLILILSILLGTVPTVVVGRAGRGGQVSRDQHNNTTTTTIPSAVPSLLPLVHFLALTCSVPSQVWRALRVVADSPPFLHKHLLILEVQQ